MLVKSVCQISWAEAAALWGGFDFGWNGRVGNGMGTNLGIKNKTVSQITHHPVDLPPVTQRLILPKDDVLLVKTLTPVTTPLSQRYATGTLAHNQMRNKRPKLLQNGSSLRDLKRHLSTLLGSLKNDSLHLKVSSWRPFFPSFLFLSFLSVVLSSAGIPR
ncbi:hypothetical protein AVEN_241766-1 [Araneus ventricosus]|uniref:Uncharacterized protein n=1 Tax=Araneus ventricosus TaxID=182803 RepID=A0A4Y2FJM6_ARAVE|nr:hypothetical protein AVEN_241766-1 [Araneus ventricosus]